jgi:UDP-N-acetyl-D-glucosamine dehydrogenase
MTDRQPTCETLLTKFVERSARLCIIGMGYVGLPLAIEFGKAGFRVTGIDLNAGKCASLNAGASYIGDVPDQVVAEMVAGGRLRATSDYAALGDADVAIICVPTPLGKSKDPDISYIVAAADQLARHVHPGMLVVLESTTYPGTTEEVLLPRLRANGLQVGRDLFVAFSPERVDPGNAQWNTHNTPKVVGGATPECLRVALALYETAVERMVPVSSPATAEMVKILENTFRAVNIGFVNEMAQICHRIGIDIWEVIGAAKTKPFGYMPFYPGPGLGGHCIPIDPLYLTWKMRGLGMQTRFIELADTINSGMPLWWVGRIQDALNEQGLPLKGSRILILGVAYKPDVADLRESPALVIIEALLSKGALVDYTDPYIPEIEVAGRRMRSTVLSDDELRAADCVFVHTSHRGYDAERLVGIARCLVDVRRAG